MRKALILVDLQNDFMNAGALEVKEASAILPSIGKLLQSPFDLIIATKDWHLDNHCSFAENYPDKKPGDRIFIGENIEQILWPKHCIQNTWGSEFASGWDTSKIDKIVYKGTEVDIDSYSTFFDNQLLRSTGLEDYLRENQITDVYIAGLATDYCVKYSVLDALNLGFTAYVVVDACKGVNLQAGDSEAALNMMKQAGAHLVVAQAL